MLSKIVRDFIVRPFGEDSLVQVHEHTVLALDNIVELTLHVTMRSQSFANVTVSAPLGSKLNRLKPVDVLCKKRLVSFGQSSLAIVSI